MKPKLSILMQTGLCIFLTLLLFSNLVAAQADGTTPRLLKKSSIAVEENQPVPLSTGGVFIQSTCSSPTELNLGATYTRRV